MNRLTIHLTVLFLSVNFIAPLMADEEVVLDSDEKAREVLLNKVWKCEWKDPYYNGTSEIIYEEVSLKKVTAKVKNSYCPNGWGKYKGKIKKGREIGKTTNLPSPCTGASSGSGKYYKAADGSYYAKGQYRPTAYQANGTSKCVAVPN